MLMKITCLPAFFPSNFCSAIFLKDCFIQYFTLKQWTLYLLFKFSGNIFLSHFTEKIKAIKNESHYLPSTNEYILCLYTLSIFFSRFKLKRALSLWNARPSLHPLDFLTNWLLRVLNSIRNLLPLLNLY